MYYTTLYLVRQYLGLGTTESQDDDLLTRLIRLSTLQIEGHTDRRFDVYRETYNFDYPVPQRSRVGVYSPSEWTYWMNRLGDFVTARLRIEDQDLLEVITLTNGDDTEITSTNYTLHPARIYPKNTIRLKEGSSVTWQYDSAGNRNQVISIDGYWSYNPDYATCWVNSGDTLQADLTAIATSFSVANADGVAGDLLPYRFQTGNMLKLDNGTDDPEFLDITGVDYNNNSLTVTRGVNGTTAVAHSSGATIYVLRPWGNVELACTRLVAWRYRQKDADSFNREIILGTGEVSIPTSLPEDVTRLLPAPTEGRL